MPPATRRQGSQNRPMNQYLAAKKLNGPIPGDAEPFASCWTDEAGYAIVRASFRSHERSSTVIDRIFSWWNGVTLGASFDIHRRAGVIGKDDQGNTYLEERKASGGRRRRFVIYNGLADASRVPAEWFGWLHHIIDEPPTIAPLPRKAWEREHKANLTGTPAAYRPPGSLARATEAPAMDGYESWDPSATTGTSHAPANR